MQRRNWFDGINEVVLRRCEVGVNGGWKFGEARLTLTSKRCFQHGFWNWIDEAQVQNGSTRRRNPRSL